MSELRLGGPGGSVGVLGLDLGDDGASDFGVSGGFDHTSWASSQPQDEAAFPVEEFDERIAAVYSFRVSEASDATFRPSNLLLTAPDDDVEDPVWS